MSVPFRGLGHEDETVAEYNRRMDISPPGLMTNGRGTRSSGEALDPGTRSLAAISFGKRLETEGDLDRELLIHGKRRGTVNELNQQFEEKKAQQGKKKKPVARRVSEMPYEVQKHIHDRPAIFRSQYDAGAIPKKEIPADIAERIPKSIKGV